MTGALSSFLDNAPTYLVFFNLAGGDAAALTGPLATTLVAISAGAVFMGANTYIGNAPNFMVKSIAESRGVRMPSFLAYLGWSLLVLVPIYALLTVIFFTYSGGNAGECACIQWAPYRTCPIHCTTAEGACSPRGGTARRGAHAIGNTLMTALSKPLDAADDPDLVTRVQRGDSAAFAVLMRRYNRRLYRTARAILKDDAARRRRGAGRLHRRVSPHRRVSRRRADRHVAHAHRRQPGAAGAAQDAPRAGRRPVRGAADGAQRRRRRSPHSLPPGTPEKTMLRAEMRRLIERKIDALPEGYRTVFMLREVEDMTVDETADGARHPGRHRAQPAVPREGTAARGARARSSTWRRRTYSASTASAATASFARCSTASATAARIQPAELRVSQPSSPTIYKEQS